MIIVGIVRPCFQWHLHYISIISNHRKTQGACKSAYSNQVIFLAVFTRFFEFVIFFVIVLMCFQWHLQYISIISNYRRMQNRIQLPSYFPAVFTCFSEFVIVVVTVLMCFQLHLQHISTIDGHKERKVHAKVHTATKLIFCNFYMSFLSFNVFADVKLTKFPLDYVKPF